MKVLFGMALRQRTRFVEGLPWLIGLDWAVPDFSTLGRCQKTLAVTIPYRGSQVPLNLLVDSTGIKRAGEFDGCRRDHPVKRVLVRPVHSTGQSRHLYRAGATTPPWARRSWGSLSTISLTSGHFPDRCIAVISWIAQGGI